MSGDPSCNLYLGRPLHRHWSPEQRGVGVVRSAKEDVLRESHPRTTRGGQSDCDILYLSISQCSGELKNNFEPVL